MNLSEYQKWAETKAVKAPGAFNQLCDALGIAGEAGEYCDLIKKAHFHYRTISTELFTEELGDILYYVARSASHLGVSLQEVLDKNVRKLNARYPNGFDPARAHAPGEPPAERS